MIWPFERKRSDSEKLEFWRAFPSEMRLQAKRADDAVKSKLAVVDSKRGVGPSFQIRVSGEEILIPERLYFLPGSQSIFSPEDPAWLLDQALQTRSVDGYQRQRAVRHLLNETNQWNAPFIVALIGSYVVEILEDVYHSLTPDSLAVLQCFVRDNSDFWDLTKSRVVSYWNAYHRVYHIGPRRRFSACDYVGRRLIDYIEGRACQQNA